MLSCWSAFQSCEIFGFPFCCGTNLSDLVFSTRCSNSSSEDFSCKIQPRYIDRRRNRDALHGGFHVCLLCMLELHYMGEDRASVGG